LARRWRILITTSIAVYMALLDVTIVNIAFPDMLRSFSRVSLGDLSWILNAYNVVFAAALVPAGRIADRLGRRRMFLAGVALFLLGSLGCSLAMSVGFLVTARVVQALGAAVVVPTSLSLILPEFPVERRATATALWTATGAIAAATGPALGGVIVHLAGWRWIFVVNLLIGPPTMIVAGRLLRESRGETGRSWPDGVGAGLLATGVATLALALVKGQDWRWSSVRVLGLLALSAVVLVAFAVRTARHPVPVVEPELFRIRSFTMANVGSLVFGVGFNAMLLGNVLFLTTIWNYTVLAAGGVMTVGPVVATLTAPFAGRVADRYGQRIVAVPGGLLLAAGAALLATATGQRPDYLGVLLPATVLAGVGLGLALPAFGSAAVAELPRERFATGVAIASCARQIGAVVGVAALVAVLDTAGHGATLASFHWAYGLVCLTGVATAVAAAALGRVRARDVTVLPRPVPSIVESSG
jgi:NTE family protein